MANLIPCKTCGSKVSSSAATCPYCGHPHEKDRAEKKDMQQILILVASLAVFVLLIKLGWLEPMMKYLLDLFKK